MVKNLDLLDADELINNLYSKFKNDEEILKKAYLYASEGHINQKRASGEPYITHPLQVATCLLYTSPSPRDDVISRMPSSA